jgi:hypothetical protein
MSSQALTANSWLRLESPPALIGDAYPDILEDGQHANRGPSGAQTPPTMSNTQDSEHTSSTTNSPGPERSVVVQWLQQHPMPTAQPVQLDKLRHSPETRSQHGHALTRDMESATPKPGL